MSKIQVNSEALDNSIKQLRTLASEWSAVDTPSSKIDESGEGNINAQSEGKAIEELKSQVIAARRAKKTFCSLVEATAEYLEKRNAGYRKADK